MIFCLKKSKRLKIEVELRLEKSIYYLLLSTNTSSKYVVVCVIRQQSAKGYVIAIQTLIRS